ncbi:MAG TPA: gamma-glutamyl-gamma-aminobutyrate hydrolase family protein, partial [Gaiellales bacterium]
MRILVIQHDDDKGLGLFEQPLGDASLELDVRFAGRDEIDPSGHAAVIALPGVANPDEDTVAINATRAAIAEALRRDLPVFGICLGAELLAQAAGAAARPCAPEWGYREVALAPAAADDALLAALPARFDVFQAHNFGFDLPPGATALAGAPGALQAFRAGATAWGVQFHPEPTLAMLDGWTHALGHLMQANGVDPELTRTLGRRHVPEWSE